MKQKQKLNFLLVVATVATITIFSNCTSPESKESVATSDTTQTGMAKTESLIEHGKYLVTICGCNDCHTPKLMTAQGPIDDTAKLLSGHQADAPLSEFDKKLTAPGKWILVSQDLTAWSGPWGTSFPANLTPDKETGSGSWTPDMFIQIMRTGHHMGVPDARPILPPMPWFNFKAMSDGELESIFAYLQSIPAIKNKVPDPILASQPK